MGAEPLVSIIIDNYNYGRFVGQAIDSALAQTWAKLEIIVVDDGSTDDSRKVIEAYGPRIRCVFKDNGGQASAYNAGFAASCGDIVWFLDADDRLLPTAVEQAVRLFGAGFSQVHAPLWMVDAEGHRTGRLLPGDPLASGDISGQLLEWGPLARPTAPGSGNAWARWFLNAVMPMPQVNYRLCADAYLLLLAPLFGRLAVADPLGEYRIHGANGHWADQSSNRALLRDVEVIESDSRMLALWAVKLGYAVDAGRWARHNWRHQLRRHLLLRAGERHTGPGVADVLHSVLIDQTRWRFKAVLLPAFLLLLHLPSALARPPLCRLLAHHLKGAPPA